MLFIFNYNEKLSIVKLASRQIYYSYEYVSPLSYIFIIILVFFPLLCFKTLINLESELLFLLIESKFSFNDHGHYHFK